MWKRRGCDRWLCQILHFFEKSLQSGSKSDRLLTLTLRTDRSGDGSAIKEVQTMAKCDICGKGVTFGIKVSHSHRRSNRTWKPNVKRVKAIVDGSPCHIHACTRCLRSDKVTRAV